MWRHLKNKNNTLKTTLDQYILFARSKIRKSNFTKSVKTSIRHLDTFGDYSKDMSALKLSSNKQWRAVKQTVRNNYRLWSNVFVERCNFSLKYLNLRKTFWGIWKVKTHTFVQGCFSHIIFEQLRWPTEPKFSKVCNFMHMLGNTKWEYWSLTFTKRIQCL